MPSEAYCTCNPLQVGEEGGATHEDDVGSDNSTEKKTDPKKLQELRSHFLSSYFREPSLGIVSVKSV